MDNASRIVKENYQNGAWGFVFFATKGLIVVRKKQLCQEMGV